MIFATLIPGRHNGIGYAASGALSSRPPCCGELMRAVRPLIVLAHRLGTLGIVLFGIAVRAGAGGVGRLGVRVLGGGTAVRAVTSGASTSVRDSLKARSAVRWIAFARPAAIFWSSCSASRAAGASSCLGIAGCWWATTSYAAPHGSGGGGTQILPHHRGRGRPARPGCPRTDPPPRKGNRTCERQYLVLPPAPPTRTTGTRARRTPPGSSLAPAPGSSAGKCSCPPARSPGSTPPRRRSTSTRPKNRSRTPLGDSAYHREVGGYWGETVRRQQQ